MRFSIFDGARTTLARGCFRLGAEELLAIGLATERNSHTRGVLAADEQARSDPGRRVWSPNLLRAAPRQHDRGDHPGLGDENHEPRL